MLFSKNYVKVTGMDFSQFLKKQAQIIDIRLEEILKEISAGAGHADPRLRKIFDKFIESSKDGKRVRGALVLLGYRIGGGKNPKKVLDGAAAFEIFQTAILAQDDVIDKSPLRRFKASLYQSLGGDHRSISLTLCLSDIGFFSAYELLNSLKIEDSLKLKALSLFSKTLTQTVLGVMLDIENQYLDRDFLDEDSIRTALLKTAGYTISGPLLLGATLAGAEPKLLKQLQVFGDNLGIAFQIQDDILGIFGDEKITGKPSSADIKECKGTVLIAFAQKRANKYERKILKEYYGNEKIDEDGIEKIRSVFKNTGALEYASSRAKIYFDKARKSLKGNEKELLYSLVEFLRKRVN